MTTTQLENTLILETHERVNLIEAIQVELFRDYGILKLQYMYPFELNGEYTETLRRKKIIAGSNTIRFVPAEESMYIRRYNGYYQLIAWVEPLASQSSKILGELDMEGNAWLMLEFRSNPEVFVDGVNQFERLNPDNPVLSFLGYSKGRFGYSTFPSELRVKYT